MKMNIVKTLVFLVLVTGLFSCATSSRVGPEFEAGRIYSRDFAKDDAWKFDCFWYPGRVFAAQKAREYTDTLKTQGKSQTFIDGFYFGYERYYYQQLNVKCSE